MFAAIRDSNAAQLESYCKRSGNNNSRAWHISSNNNKRLPEWNKCHAVLFPAEGAPYLIDLDANMNSALFKQLTGCKHSMVLSGENTTEVYATVGMVILPAFRAPCYCC